MTNALENSPMMHAVQCRNAEKVPVWCMRQAGRYMPEYQAVRSKYPFIELCKRPELAAEVMLTAVKVLGVDAAILFSDILLLLEPMGFTLDYVPDEGPRIAEPVRQPEDVHRVHELASPEQLQYILDAVRFTREGLPPDIPLIGFAGAPFTLASYAVEGGGSKNFRQVKAFMHLYPDNWQTLMRILAVSIARLLNAQIDAGVQIVQIFDSWAGCLSAEDYKKYVQPYSKMLIDLLRPGTPIIHFAPGNPVLLPSVRDAGGHVIGVDWRVSIDDAWNT
ncbi:MAG: uroporphyrinogen decarboxylase, partial [Planctomycetaceae bacterium]|nr:uroporphyrinogen decarboxylase [Planctomycetaceae bacterium]